ncbi:hemin uptake protein HemP [Verminephrobacter aporrectodeae subsp. tuberculatae]|uniref:hemin uptake protein HemP n=1 Tax=Verminephrobacter aporrectodeae TaxID=1110389 RepID=UPI0022439414|nr:hemin uptake protein HemP [Verminephrobacter aporrectodeae]MCW8166386.1 hemin uptake protein HemP [Verminephrobacter aporrectodeae subsp. tuberculatae]MCW8170814.1 hemin uptake protein HemP [Verminephrobacter aporrectodeae subsp. tuberculatae]
MQASMTSSFPLLHPVPADRAGVPSAADAAAARCAGTMAFSFDSSTLLQGQKAVTISHNGSVYRLQATKLGKLILTK